jgi:type I restriction enzyme, S subunit
MLPVESLVTDHLDLWTAALKRKSTAGRGSSSKVELYGIKKLRELILELAVRGLLVPQDPNDEPASELLKRIAAEKAGLVKKGKIKKEKPFPPIAELEKPFYLPVSWSWEHLADVFYPISVSKNKVKTSELSEEGKYPVVDQGQSFIAGYVDDESLLNILPGPVIVFGDHTSALKYVNFNFVAGADGVKILRPIGCDEHYFFLVCKTLPIESRGYGRHYSRLVDNFFPLPPLAEQHSIVAKVDELMALCDQLEQETEASFGAHQTLVETLLSALTSTADHAQFASAWQRIACHFDTLFTTKESIAQLKQTILQLAVMGKLVPQDPNDEPASELLKKIAAEKAKLVKEGKIKKEKPLPPTAELEKPFDLPVSWAWKHLADVFYPISVSNNKVKTSELSEVGKYPVVDQGQSFIAGYVDDDSLLNMLPGPVIVFGDHTSALKYIDFNFVAGADGVKILRPICCYERYFYLACKTLPIESRGYGRHYSRLVDNFFPLAPLAEQHRIVAKVDELMALCDQLKSRLSDAQTTQLHLADALVEQAIG